MSNAPVEPGPADLQKTLPSDLSGPVVRREKPLIFISHRHADKDIATRLARWIEGATGTRVEVFQSSSGFRGGDVSRTITETIRQNVSAAAIMLVLYTDDDADWAWVMFEMGIAMDPSTPQTELIILQCGDDSPRILSEFTRVRIGNEEDRVGLVRKLLTSEAYPTHKGFVIGEDKDDYVRGQAETLWAQLKDAVPDGPLKREMKPHPSLRIDVPLSALGSLNPGDVERREGLRQPIREAGRITAEHEMRQVFPLSTTVELTLSQLHTGLQQFKQADWVDSCIDTLATCALNYLPQEPIARVAGVSGAYQPVLTRTQHKWFDKIVRFDVSFVPAKLVLPPVEATAPTAATAAAVAPPATAAAATVASPAPATAALPAMADGSVASVPQRPATGTAVPAGL